MAAVALLGLGRPSAPCAGRWAAGGAGPTTRPTWIDSLLLLLFLAMLAGAVLAVWSLWPDRHLLAAAPARGSFSLILPMAAVLPVAVPGPARAWASADDPTASTTAPPAPSRCRPRRPSRGWCR
jgi:hypothetical protein